MDYGYGYGHGYEWGLQQLCPASTVDEPYASTSGHYRLVRPPTSTFSEAAECVLVGYTCMTPCSVRDGKYVSSGKTQGGAEVVHGHDCRRKQTASSCVEGQIKRHVRRLVSSFQLVTWGGRVRNSMQSAKNGSFIHCSTRQTHRWLMVHASD